MAVGIDRIGKPMVSDPLRNFRFLVKFLPYTWGGSDGLARLGGGKAQFGFTSVSGLSVATEAIPYREGGMNTTLHQIPGQTTFSPITLSRGVHLGRSEAWYWMKRLFSVTGGENGPDARSEFRASVEIQVLTHPVTRANDLAGSGTVGNAFAGSRNDPIAVSFKVYNAWIQSIAYSDLNAGDNAVLVEQMVLAHEGFSMAWPEANDKGNGLPTYQTALKYD
jgi:phage tail-like protein